MACPMRIRQIPLLWMAVVALASIQVFGLGAGPDPEPEGSPDGGSLRRLEQRVARIEAESGEIPTRPSLATTRTPVETSGDLESRIARLEERVQRLEEVHAYDEVPPEADPGLLKKLNAAIARGDDEAVWRILASGLDVNGRDEDRRTPLATAAIAGRVEMLDLLIGKGAGLERASGRRSMTPLLAALDAVQEDAALALLERGADPEAVDKNGESALIWAAFNGCGRVVERLLAAGVPADFRAHDGATALTDAARRGHLDIVRRLLAHGADVNSRDKAGRTALTHALDAGQDAIAELLRRHGAVR